ncbi:M15 family metallopeptidase [Agarivorans sp. MS3-6]|uniref:M15 family metallopeptidase n=1 Tax=Agarivorans sp. TSD2052 TaxID=2937286 RepID=UPI00200D04CF|nr:M15 family metallopeptidase [Agarivorans sp. TSD2052]UPW19829.1 M15 family metallopeptidase [Agarivorans sp. TSD2052]
MPVNQLALYGLSKDLLLNVPNLGWVHREVLADLENLRAAAKQAGFQLSIFSGYRDFQRQLTIWNNKWNGLRPVLDADSKQIDTSTLSKQQKMHAILRWSALPGASRHHWGCDFDLYDPSLLKPDQSLELIPQEYAANGCQHPFALWLEQHAPQHGFFYPYHHFQGGVEFEPWHLSHWQTSSMLISQLEPQAVLSHLKAANVAGFATIEKHIDQLFNQYVTNICLPES